MFKKIFPILCVLIFVISCGTKVKARHMAPAKFQIAGVHKLAVAEFESRHIMYRDWGRTISDRVASELEGKGFFSVISGRSDFGVSARGEEMDPGWRDWALGEGVDAVLVGSIIDIGVTRSTYHREQKHDVHTGRYRYETYTEGGQVKRRRVEIIEKEIEYIPVVTKRARLRLVVYLMDVATGTRIDREEYKEDETDRADGYDQVRRLDTDYEMLEDLIDDMVPKVVRDLIPHAVEEKIQLLGGRGCKEGVKLAKDGHWGEAEAAWKELLAGDPDNDVAMYNLGVAAEVAGRYDEAEQRYLGAMELTGKKLYKKAWERANRLSIDREKLDEQLEGRTVQ